VPTYQYVCTDCEAPLEVVQSFSDDALTDCPSCEGGRLRKVYGSVGVVFKGSGFYRNDSRSGSSGGGSSASSGSSAGSSDSSASPSSGSSESGAAAGNPSTGATSAAGHSVTPAASTP